MTFVLWLFVFFGTVPPAQNVTFTAVRQGKQEITILLIDPASSGRRSRVVARLAPSENRVSVPEGKYVAVCVSKEGDGAFAPIDGSDPEKLRILCRAPKPGEGVAIIRTSRTPQARSLDVRRLRLTWGKSAAAAKMVGDVAVFGGIPRGTEVAFDVPSGSCDLTDIRFTLDGAWVLRDAELGLCSELTLRLSSDPEKEVPPLEVELARFMGDPVVAGKPGRAVGKGRLVAGEPLRFRDLAPGNYWIRARESDADAVLTDVISVPAQTEIEHTLELISILVHGRARLRDDEATGLLRFVKQNGPLRREIEAKIVDGEYEARLLEPGCYSVALVEQGQSDGTSTTLEVPASAEFRADLLFKKSTLAGHVQDRDGKPIAGANVEVKIVDEADESTTWLESEADGGFSFDHLNPGSCEVRASKPGYRMPQPVPRFFLEDGASAVQDLVLTKARSATVTLRTAGGRPASGVELYCAPAAAPFEWNLMGSTDDQGSLEIEMEDRQPLSCSAPNPLGAISQFTLTRAEPVTWRLAGPGGRVRISAREPNQSPIAFRTILVRANGDLISPFALWRHASARGGSSVLDANGTARLDDIPAGWIEIYLSRGMNDLDAFARAAANQPDARIGEFALDAGDERTVDVTLRRER